MKDDYAKDLAIEWARLGPFEALDKLGVKYKRLNRRQAVTHCPWHAEKTPSCTVAIGPEGTLRTHCFGCDESRDVHALFAQVRGLDVTSQFVDVLREEAAELGRWDICDGIDGKAEPRPAPARKATPKPLAEPERVFPPAEEVGELLGACVSPERDPEVSAWLLSRGLDPHEVSVRDLCLALPKSTTMPRWASYQHRTWVELGHRLIVPLYDHAGEVRSVRAGRVCDGGSPKRLPPAGHACTGLVMADSMAREVLRLGRWPEWTSTEARFVVCEGEPDFLTWAVRTALYVYPSFATLGIFSGAWSDEIAGRIPDMAKVAVWTDDDAAGDKYAKAIEASLASRCRVIRGRV